VSNEELSKAVAKQAKPSISSAVWPYKGTEAVHFSTSSFVLGRGVRHCT